MNFDNLNFFGSKPQLTVPEPPTSIVSTTEPSTREQPFYIVVAPEKVRSFCDLAVAVTVVGNSQPVSVTLSLYGEDKDNPYIQSVTASIETNSTQLVKIPIKELARDEYSLSVKGDEYFRFENTTSLQFVEKFLSVFIQTDRAMYKPGHKVQFRVLILNSKLKPFPMNKVNVLLKDGIGNRVKEWKKVEAVKGVYSNEIQLSPYPVLGDWSIVVTAFGKEHVKKFTVAEYVLPKFEVFVDVPPHATYANSTVPVTVSAKYTFGQYVKGEATIRVRPQYTFYQEDSQDNSKVIRVDTVSQTTIDVVSALKLQTNQFYERTLVFEVAFKEDVTEKVINGSAALKLHHAVCKVDFHRIFDYFIPGDIYKTILKISNWDDTPFVSPKPTPVRVRHGKGWDERENAAWKEHHLPATGVMELNFETEEGTEVLNIQAEYMGVNAYDTVVNKQPEESKNSSALDLTVLNDKRKIGDNVDVDIFTNGEASFLSYCVIGRNEITEAKTKILSDGQNVHRTKIHVTPNMAPDSHIMVVFVSSKGELLAAEKEVRVDNVLANFVKISATPTETEPGKDIVIQVESKPNSIVGLMGVDQSVILLKKGNDISRDDVEKDLQGYDNTWYGGSRYGKTRRSTNAFMPGYSAREVFTRAGCIVMTNAYIPEEKMFECHTTSCVLFGSAPQSLTKMSCALPVTLASTLQKQPDLPSSSVVIRTKFPETWIWNIEDSGSQGKTIVRKVVPDTITSWVISGFSISPDFGLGLSDDLTKVRVFRPFFISLNLPYSITRDESIILPTNVFNYLDKELKVDVTLENPGWFNFSSRQDSESAHTKTVVVASNSVGVVNFMITPKQIGHLEVKVIAKSPLAGDGVSRKLLVKPEGETQYRTRGVLVDLRNHKEMALDVKLDIPEDIVPDSDFIEVSVIGDLLGSSLDNLDKLIRQPSGCGEQTMLSFVPIIVILDYLKNTNLLTPSIQKMALKYLEMGYQRELTFKHKNNSFSAFGEFDKSGSTWLTAFVAKSFKQAQKFIDIEAPAILEPLRWVAAKQHRNGSFSEVGQVVHKEMQGGASHNLALTAYVLTALVEVTSLTDEFKDNIERAARFINEQIERGNIDTYSLAVTSYVLNLANHPAKDKAFNLLESKSKTEAETKWWVKDKTDSNENPWDTCIPNAINVEVTAYAMLSYLYREMNTEALPILRWLMTQQNSCGGFASTQDTVVALGAIAKLAKIIVSKNTDLSVTFEYPGGPTKLKVTSDNSLLLQKADLPATKIRNVAIEAKGSGLGIVQIAYRYNVNKKGVFPLFNLIPKVEATSTKDHLILGITTSYTGGKESNMAVMEVTLPTGFIIDDEGLRTLRSIEKIKKVETKADDTLVILYFDKVTSESICFVVSAYKSFKVAKQRPVPITIYDYYDNSRRAVEFYSCKPSEFCEACEADDCQHCEIKA